MKKIAAVQGIELLDSRGNPTVGAQVTLSDGAAGFALAPSGASTGAYEACELRDRDPVRYRGKGTLKAVENINGPIAKTLSGQSCDLKTVDSLLLQLDGTESKENLGANAILAVSMAAARAAAVSYKLPLYRYLGGFTALSMPLPMMNILNGGAHAANNLDIQEFMIIPKKESFHEALHCGVQIYRTLGEILQQNGLSTGVGDEGGFAPNLNSDRSALELICEAVTRSGYNFEEVGLALDVAASEWYQDGKYYLPKQQRFLSSEELSTHVEELCRDFPILSVEDPLSEEDWNGWSDLTAKCGHRVQLVGDDLFVTNQKRLRQGFEQKAANAILIKPNQIGTVTETLEVMQLAQKHSYNCVVSHRSGETEDTFIADLAVATGAPFIKSGAPCRTDRTAKYNRLLAIEQAL